MKQILIVTKNTKVSVNKSITNKAQDYHGIQGILGNLLLSCSSPLEVSFQHFLVHSKPLVIFN